MASAETPKNPFIERLAQTLDGQKAIAAFCCGGKIASKLAPPGKKPRATPESVPPETPILFYEDKNGQSHKITFPPTIEQMENLASECDPASFGVGSQEVMDMQYRSAWKLDNTKFATSFHPNNTDIMQIIRNILFAAGSEKFYIVPELYKLNALPPSVAYD
jgi:hypothetical protein